MRITIEVVKLGGGYKKAIIGHSMNSLGEWCADSVFGKDEEELLARLKIRLPALKKTSSGQLDLSGRAVYGRGVAPRS